MVEPKFLPIGTIVTLKDGGNSQYMITKYLPIFTRKWQTGYFDYGAALYPNGEGEDIFHFNEEDIAEVIFEGYHSEKLKNYQKELLEKEDKIPWKQFSNIEKKSDPLAKLLKKLKK